MSNTGVALITGGGSGLGLAIAEGLGDAGWAIGLIGRSDDRVDLARRSLEARGIVVVHAAADVRDSNALDSAIDRIESMLGGIDVVVHAAGVLNALGPLWEQDETSWHADFDTSALGAFLLVRRIVPSMVQRRSGRIVLVSSGVAIRASPYRAGYAAGKAALLSVTEALAAEIAPFGLTAFAIAPGFVETDMTKRMVETPWFADLAGSPTIPAALTAGLVVRIAAGDADPLSGRLLHALDDLDEMLSRTREIETEELYVARLRRLRLRP